MRTLYIPKQRLSSYVEFPVPENLDEHHQVEVADDFRLLPGYVFDPTIAEFVPRQPTSDEVDTNRRAAYATDVDPLLSEATIKRAMGLVEQADALIAQAIAAREAIKIRYPKPA